MVIPKGIFRELDVVVATRDLMQDVTATASGKIVNAIHRGAAPQYDAVFSRETHGIDVTIIVGADDIVLVKRSYKSSVIPAKAGIQI